MAQVKPTETEMLQIRMNDPEIVLKFKVYATAHRLSHGELLTKAFLALLAAENQD